MNLRNLSIITKAEKGFYSGLTKIRTRRRSRRQYR
ncbi:glycosyl transferase family 1 [Neisseria meningitidis]|nr:glycosyl transferase family 1 [Neisseria meningitidis]